MIRERVAMAFLRRFGVPASREAFATVFVNGQYAGLYAMVEEVDTLFAQRTLGDANGALFEYRWQGPYYGEYPRRRPRSLPVALRTARPGIRLGLQPL